MLSIKKMTLLCCFISTLFSYNVHADDTDILIAAGVTTVVVGTGVYVAFRETNSSKIDRAYKIINMYGAKVQRELLKITTAADIYLFANQSYAAKKELTFVYETIDKMHSEISRRYNCWVTPWNWSSNMKQAYEAIHQLYEQATILHMMIEHGSLLSVGAQEAELVKAARVFCGGVSNYPIVFTVNRLKEDMKRMSSMQFYVPCEYIYLEYLDEVCRILMCSDAYVQDCREHEKHVEQMRIVAAAEAQAQAQSRQAAALEKRNEIEEQKK